MENIENVEKKGGISDTLEYAKKIGAIIYSDKEKEKANIVSNDFKGLKPSNNKYSINTHYTNQDLAKMYYTCLNTYEIFDNDFLINTVNDILTNIPIIDGNHLNESLFQVIYQTEKIDDKQIKIPKLFIIPSILNSKTAGHALVHEIAHIIKNNNEQEEKLFMTYNEVIPILLEMISAYESSPIETKEVFRKIYDYLLKTRQLYYTYTEIAKFQKINTDENNLLIATAGQYLTSFYYAISLFNEYIERPYSILEDMCDVLNCEATTLELLDYHIDQDDDTKYKRGLSKFKKLI